LYNANLNEVVSVENDTKINEAISISIGQKGCTYKCSFEEPLYETVSELSVPVTVIAPQKSVALLSEDEVRVCYDLEHNKKIGLSGRNEPRAISDSTIETLAADESVVV
jgi:2-succinyl-5-enolpyruvyl-6-hydroxy-3-cyclohexene-1-carboxylate synthase